MVPSYAEDEADSADDFEEPLLPTLSPKTPSQVLSQSTQKKNTPKKKPSKTRKLFEESEDEEMTIDDASSFEERFEGAEAFPSLRDYRNTSTTIRLTPKKYDSVSHAKKILEKETAKMPDSEDDFNISDVSPQKMLTQSSNTETPALSSVSNPFQNILAQMRQKMTATKQLTAISTDDESSGDDYDQLFEPKVPPKRSLKVRISRESSLARSPAAESENLSEFHDSFNSSTAQEAPAYIGNPRKASSDTKLMEARRSQELKSALSGEEPLEETDSDESEFGAFKNVVRDVMLNTSRLSQSQEPASDSESSAF